MKQGSSLILSAAEVLIVAPIGHTADAARHMLEGAGMPCTVCIGVEQLTSILTDNIGALLLLEEGLTTTTVQILAGFLTSQPVWSDLPVVVFTGEEPTQARYEATLALLGGRRNVTLLRRPVPAWTLVSVMQSALADRTHQFQIRDLLHAREQAQQALETSQRDMREMLDRIGDIFVAIDNQGNVTYANRHLRQLIGRRIRTGQNICEAIPEMHDMDINPLFAEAMEGLRPVHGEVMEPSTGRWFEFNLYPSAAGMSIYAREVTERKQAEAKVQAARRLAEESHAHLQELTASLEQRVQHRTEQTRRLTLALTQAEQQERQRISQFLHDDLQQILYGLQMRLHLLSQDLPEEAWQQLFKHTETMRGMIDEAIQRTRVLTVDLSPPVLKEPNLRTALIWLAEQMYLRHNLRVNTSDLSSVAIADESERTLLFQIVRELLFNVAKHAGVDAAKLVLYADEGACVIEVIDRGNGFRTAELHKKSRHGGGFGLHSVEERIEILGGTLKIESTPGHGTRAILRAPLKGVTA